MRYRGCKLEISGILLIVDLRVMDMLEFGIILGVDWLTAYKVVIDCKKNEDYCLHTGWHSGYVSRGQPRCFSLDRVRFQMARTVGGLDD